MDHSTGDLNYIYPNSSLLFEFFATGKSTKIDVLGFAIDWRDLDKENGGGIAGTFTMKDRLGNTTILDTSTAPFSLGSGLGTTDVNNGNSVNPDAIKSNENGNWDNERTAFTTIFATTPLHSFSVDNTTDWIAPTSIRFSAEIVAIPEPATILVWSLLGAASWLGMGVWRRGQHGGRRSWSEENRTAIHDIIARGGRN